ncbi:undecaprenyl-diphosphatase UppP [Patescibacteria group bacterium]|nr:undecaprenyl-diphosphatase UppP [Patescibacteria group bacterium]MBU1922209.1 undecaprenyl-diphosphatase UppP [Patescibacteria group bacterium]
MDLTQAIVLGIVQGLTEFLPISSSGHLLFSPKFFHWPEQSLEFDAVMHLATLIAVLFFFRKEVFKIKRAMIFKNPATQNFRRLGWIILIGTIPALALGAALATLPVNYFRSTEVAIIGLIGWAVVMFLADRALKIKQSVKQVQNIGWKQGIVIGLAQAIALIPGTSRSGITITVGLLQGTDRPTAARFSFLLGIPAILAAGLFSLVQISNNDFRDVDALGLLLGFAAALASGYLSIKFLIKFLEKYNLDIFVLYRIILGVILIGLFW